MITAASNGHTSVRGLVYIAAMAPDSGETVAGLLHRAPAHPLAPPLAPGENGWIWMSKAGFANAVAPDSTAAEIETMFSTQKPVALAAITEPMGTPGWLGKHSWFLLAGKDRIIAPETQRFMAVRMNATVWELPVDHTPLTSAPDKVANLILEAIKSGESGDA